MKLIIIERGESGKKAPMSWLLISYIKIGKDASVGAGGKFVSIFVRLPSRVRSSYDYDNGEVFNGRHVRTICLRVGISELWWSLSSYPCRLENKQHNILQEL